MERRARKQLESLLQQPGSKQSALCASKSVFIDVPLVGKAWSYLDDCEVWRTSLAAEYTCGLCVAWSKSLMQWLSSPLGRKWMQARPFVRLAQFVHRRNYLSKKCGRPKTLKLWEVCATPDMVMRFPSLREVGRRIRKIVDRFVSDELLHKLCEDITSGVEQTWIVKVRSALCEEFNAAAKEDLWKKMLEAAEGVDAECLSDWIRNGFPLGTKHPIENTGVFPATDSVSEAILESKLHGHLKGDEDGSPANYVNFYDSVVQAQALPDQLVAEGRSETFSEWGDVVKLFGSEAKLTRLACIVKLKDSGELKYRLVVDSRRSGVNGLMDVKERVILPKITDVAAAIRRLLVVNDGWTRQQL